MTNKQKEADCSFRAFVVSVFTLVQWCSHTAWLLYPQRSKRTCASTCTVIWLMP